MENTFTILGEETDLKINSVDRDILLNLKLIYHCGECSCDTYHIVNDSNVELLFQMIHRYGTITSIIEKKRDGVDCTETESAEIKGWLKDTLLSVTDGTVLIEREIQNLFPQEYGEYLDEVEENNNSNCNIKIIDGLLSDINAYKEDITNLLNRALEQDGKERQYWVDWFNGNDMKKYN